MLYLSFFSPPSPVLLLAPARKKPLASSLWDFSDIAPNEIPPEPNRLIIDEHSSIESMFNIGVLIL